MRALTTLALALLIGIAGISHSTTSAIAQAVSPNPNPSGSPCATASPDISNAQMPTDVPNVGDAQIQAAIAQGISAYQQTYGSGAGAAQLPTPPPPDTPNCGGVVSASQLLTELIDGAIAFQNQPTNVPGTNCPNQPNTAAYWGHCACAWAVSKAMSIGLPSHYNPNYYGVDSYYNDALGHVWGGSLVPDSQALPGDIIMWYSTDHSVGHIGYCLTTQCTSVLANSSSRQVFAPSPVDITDDGSYPPPDPHYIYSPTHIP